MTTPTPAETARELTDEELNAIEARAKRAPRPDWILPEYDKAKPRHKILVQLELVDTFTVQVTPFAKGDVPTAEFIAHARSDVPALLAEVRRLKAALTAAHAQGWDECVEACAKVARDNWRSNETNITSAAAAIRALKGGPK